MDPLEIPEDLSVLDDAALAEFLQKALEEAASYDGLADKDLDDEKLSRLLALADAATTARDLQATRADAAAERSEKIANARAALTAPEPEDEKDPEPEPEDEKDPAPEPEKEPVTAAAPRRPVVARAASAAPKPVIAAPKAVPTLFASADVPGYATGSELADLDAVAAAITARAKSLPSHRIGGDKGVQMRYSTARIDFSAARTDKLTQNEFGQNDMGLIQAAAQESRLQGGSLTAAGGWCAPSETLYDLCSIESTDGLLSIPSTQWSRGGIRFTKGPSFEDIYNNPDLGWWLTEAQVIAGDPEKTCVEIECPDFEEVRLDAIGLCVRLPLLTQAAYPELTRRWTEGILIAHQHKVDAAIIQKIADGSSTLDATGNFETTVDGITKLEQMANWVRQSWRMSFSETLEVLAPYWYKTTIRGDLARRNGQPFNQVTDAQITQYFANIGLSVQWLYNYQPLEAAVENPGGGAKVVTTVETPDTVNLLMYPAGTWVKGTTDVINLDTVYDSQSLQQNMFTALFTEEGIGLANTCFNSYEVTVPNCGSGRVGAADITSCVLAPAAP